MEKFFSCCLFSPHSHIIKISNAAAVADKLTRIIWAGKCLFRLLVVLDKCKKKGTIEASRLFSKELFGERL